ncbi:MAG: EAL domain-containing protein [Syntrophales bacterium]|nr:EAL domain-containing protein [Syntrophales bacterium]
MADDGPAAVENQLFKSQIAALEQLLEVYEKSVLEITDELYAEIAKRKQMEETLRLTQFSVDIAVDAIFWLRPDASFCYVNDAACRLLNYSRKELLTMTAHDVNPDHDRTTWATHWEELKQRKSLTFEAAFRTKDGRMASVAVSGNYLEFGNEAYNFSFARDITELKKAEEALRLHAHFLQTLINTIPNPIFYKDIHGVYLGCNAAFEAYLGLDKSRIVGKSVYDFAPKELADKYHEMDRDLLHGGGIQVYESSVRYADATMHDVIFNKATYTNTDGSLGGLVGVILDITERKQAEDRIQYLATHDSLTGLPNRLMFSQLLNHSIQSARHHKRQLAVFFIDLDRFKIINDTMGHEAGDQLLQEIALRFKQSLRAADVVGRLGGDEFIILIEEVNELCQVAMVANKILTSTIKPMVLLGEECRVTASIGISIYPKDGEDEQSLMKNADIAMYFAKEEGKNNCQFYSKDIQSQSIERLSIETNLRLALERNELSLHYQAKVDFKTNMITGVEALLRWQNPYLGSVTPTQFIPVAEESGLIIPIGRWVIKTACAQNVAWQQQGLPVVCMAVNLSLRQLTDDNLIDDIGTALKDSGMAPNLLELEITESMVMHNPARMISVLAKIKSLGVRLAIDDFGTGYSSLAQIKHFPIDTLKVDRSFIRNIPKDAEDKAITEAIIAMGKTLSLTVVAEGVETLEQMNFLKEHSCDEMQGFYFSKPIVPEQFADLLRKHVPSPPE